MILQLRDEKGAVIVDVEIWDNGKTPNIKTKLNIFNYSKKVLAWYHHSELVTRFIDTMSNIEDYLSNKNLDRLIVKSEFSEEIKNSRDWTEKVGDYVMQYLRTIGQQFSLHLNYK